MFHSHSIRFVVTLSMCAASLAGGCSHSTNPTSTVVGDSGIGGRVYLVDSTGYGLRSYAGVTVTLDAPNQSMVTDDSGNWQFRGLGFGQWHVTFSKAGFGNAWVSVYKSTDAFPPSAGDANWFKRIPSVELGQMPTSHMYLDSFGVGLASHFPPIPDSTTIVLYSHSDWDPFAPGRPGPGVLTTISDDPSFSASAPHLFYPDDHGITRETLTSAGFTRGETVYVSMATCANSHGANPLPNAFPSESWDSAHFRYVYTACGPRSNVLSFKVPR